MTLERAIQRLAPDQIRNAADLIQCYADGYRFSYRDLTWFVHKPDGTNYTIGIHPVTLEANCSCPATRTCKHLRSVWTLEDLFPQVRHTDNPEPVHA